MPVAMRLGEAFIELKAKDGGLGSAIQTLLLGRRTKARLSKAAEGAGEGVGGSLIGASLGIAAFVAAAAAAVTALYKFTQAANPVVMEQFDEAISDLMAVVGQVFVPVFERLTVFLQQSADVLLVFTQVIAAAVEAMMRFVDVILAWTGKFASWFSMVLNVPLKSARGLGSQGKEGQFSDLYGAYKSIASKAAGRGRATVADQTLAEAQQHSELLKSIDEKIGNLKPAVGR